MSRFSTDFSEEKRRLCDALNAAREKFAPTAEAARTWRRLAARAGEAVAALDLAGRARLIPAYGQDARKLQAALKACVKGEAVATPTLTQRRRSARLPVRIPCQATAAGQTVAGEIDNVSRQGLGLACKLALAVGSRVAVDLRDGRRLEATVASAGANRFGLSLTTPLTNDDPLFCARR